MMLEGCLCAGFVIFVVLVGLVFMADVFAYTVLRDSGWLEDVFKEDEDDS